MRAEFQVLVLPFIRKSNKKPMFCLLRRANFTIWQFISGGGENLETPKEAAIRETYEEAQIRNKPLYKLDNISSVPTYFFKDHANKKHLYVVPCYHFAVELKEPSIIISNEHTDYMFCEFQQAHDLLRFDDNKTALWELNKRLERNDLILA